MLQYQTQIAKFMGISTIGVGWLSDTTIIALCGLAVTLFGTYGRYRIDRLNHQLKRDEFEFSKATQIRREHDDQESKDREERSDRTAVREGSSAMAGPGLEEGR